MTKVIALDDLLTSADRAVLEATTAGTAGRLPLTAEMLLERPSGDIFGQTRNAGMGWAPSELGRPQFLMLGTQDFGHAARSISFLRTSEDELIAA